MPVTLAGPTSLTPLGFCVICAAQWKSDAIDHQRQAIEVADKAPTTSRLTLKPPGPPPAAAVAWGLVTLPPPPGSPVAGPLVVPAPLCWTHLNAIRFTAGGIIPAPAGAILLDGTDPRLGPRRPPA
ncbi:MAG TPA: hypothetical protein VEV45_21130 [Streptosporangiaceae bacterium]|nr:hypothetical protein [Streptosporangiaceae bacterium]